MNEIDLRRFDLNLLVVFEALMAERGVTRAAERLGRTQSAVSHSLARLRDQLGDPLLVRAGGRMQPSPLAIDMIEQVRPILRGIERVLAQRRTFDPATSRRAFRLAIPDFALTLFPRLVSRLRERAPFATLEFNAPREAVLLELAEGQIDIAMAPAGLRLPEGVEREIVGAYRWCCFGRRGHPAFARWGLKAWSHWPHVVVGVGNRLGSAVGLAAAAAGVDRAVAAQVPNFAAVAPLLAQSDLLATLPAIVMVDSQQRFDLVAMEAPLSIEPISHTLLWNARLGRDPAIVLLRGLVRAAIQEILASADAMLPSR